MYHIFSRYLPAVVLTAAFLLISCSGTTSNPIVPQDNFGITPPSSHSGQTQGKMLWGFWNVSIDTSNSNVSVVPVRGVEFKANVTMFLQPPAGSLAFLKFENLDLSDYLSEGKIELDVALTHPFPGLDQYTGFDVMGAFLNDSNYVSQYDPEAIWAWMNPDGANLLNSDGVTRWFNAYEFPQPGILGYTPGVAGSKNYTPGATLNPYKYFADNLEAEDSLTEFFASPNNCADRGCFRAGSTNKRHYTLQFAMDSGSPVLRYQYGVFASWEPPLGIEPGYPISDFPISANMAESLVLAADTLGSDIYYTDPSTFGGTLKLNIELLDHQGAVNASGVTAEIAGIVIECPDALLPGGYEIIMQSELEIIAEPGGPSSSVYQIDIPNCEPAGTGDKPLLVWVLSEEPSDYNSGIPGFPYPESAELAGFWAGSVTVGTTVPDLPPVGGDLSLHWECPGDPCSGKYFTVEISEAYDPDGLPVTITWDFDGNMDFADDMDGDDTNLEGEYVYDLPDVYECWCRIDDGSMQTDVGPLSITVSDCIPDAPVVAKEVLGPTTSWISYDVAYNPDGGFAYCAYSSGNAGTVQVVDVDPIADPQVTGQVTFTYLQCSIACKGSYVYVGGVYLNGISTIDATDPYDPQIIGTYYQGLDNAMINDMEVVGDYLYAAAQWGGILVFDITDPSAPQYVGKTPGTYPTITNSGAVAVTDDNQWGFFTDGYEINPDMDDYVKVVDLSDPTSPEIVNQIMVHFHFYSDMDVQGDYLYLTESGYFSVFDISDLPNIDFVFSGTGLGGTHYDIDVSGNYAYLVNGIWGSGTLDILDISDPSAPSLFTSLALPGGGQGVNEYCGELYIAASYNLLDIVDLY